MHDASEGPSPVQNKRLISTFEMLIAKSKASAARHGWTVTELAAATGASPSTIWDRIWRGEILTIEVENIPVITPAELVKLGLL